VSDSKDDQIIEPTEAQIATLLSGDTQGPFHFVNLLKFREKADYPADHPLAGKAITGEEAYRTYGMVAHEHVTKRGGRLVTLNSVEQQLIGNSQEWHQVATMEYQNIEAFMDMISDPNYVESLTHRDAGLEATEVFVTRPIISQQ